MFNIVPFNYKFVPRSTPHPRQLGWHIPLPQGESRSKVYSPSPLVGEGYASLAGEGEGKERSLYFSTTLWPK